jgi:hypothetical protein
MARTVGKITGMGLPGNATNVADPTLTNNLGIVAAPDAGFPDNLSFGNTILNFRIGKSAATNPQRQGSRASSR